MKSTIRTYSELITFQTMKERFRYLKIGGLIGESTFGFDRYLNQALYTSKEWRDLRHHIIARDEGNDMALDGWSIGDRIIIHHINPLTMDDVYSRNPDIFNPEYLVCVSQNTHNAIHFGDETLLPKPVMERRPGDTCPWLEGVLHG